MPLKINVKSGEKFIVNGAVMAAGEKGASLVLQNEATILLGKDIMQEEDANSPAKRIYFTILLMYLDNDDSDRYRGTFLDLVESFLDVTTFKEVRLSLLNVVQDVNEKRFYRALKTCKALIKYEAEILKIGSQQLTGSD